MYNPGIQKTQVQTEVLYQRWIIGALKADVTAAILKHEADIIQLCELGGIEDGLGPTLRNWKRTNRAAKPGDYHLVDAMLLELVSDPDIVEKHPSGFSVHAVNHYGLLASKDTVRLVDLPCRVGPLCAHQTYRVAQRCSFTANTNNVEKPVYAVELWNVHCPASSKYPYSSDARARVLEFLQTHAGPRAIYGTDLNQSLWKLSQQPWKVRQPENGKHGDIVCWRGVTLDLKHIPIGKGEPMGVSDSHVMIGCELQTEFLPAKPTKADKSILASVEASCCGCCCLQ